MWRDAAMVRGVINPASLLFHPVSNPGKYFGHAGVTSLAKGAALGRFLMLTQQQPRVADGGVCVCVFVRFSVCLEEKCYEPTI